MNISVRVSSLTFVRNRGELSEGWYDPETLQKAFNSQRTESAGDEPINSDSDDSIGPSLPGLDGTFKRNRVGPSIPNMQDLELKRGKDCLDESRTSH